MPRHSRGFSAAFTCALVLLLGADLLAGCASTSKPPQRPSVHPVWTPPASAPVVVEKQQPGDWLRYGFDSARSGVNPYATRLTPATVGGLHRLWQVHLPNTADSSPALLHNLPFPDGSRHDVLYLTTLDGRLIALDVGSGAPLWTVRPAGPRITNSSPVIDPSRQTVYAYGLDGSLHRYATATGQQLTGNGWPAPVTLMRQSEKESSALNIAEGHVYVTTSGYIGDAPPYQGHIVSVATTTGQEHVFNSLCANISHLLNATQCSDEQSGIWARGGAVVDPITGNIFATTGNGPFDANQGGHDYGDSILELSPDGSKLLDSYTPSTYDQLNQSDTDLGSAAPALLPKIAASKTPYMLVQGSKDGLLRLIDRQDMSGQGGPGHIGGELQALQSAGCATFTQPVVWTPPHSAAPEIIVAGTCGMAAYTVATDGAGTSSLRLLWHNADTTSTPVLAGGLLFAAGSGFVHAYDPTNGHQLWSSTSARAGGTIGPIHWESVIVAGGRLYIPDQNGNVTAYGL